MAAAIDLGRQFPATARVTPTQADIRHVEAITVAAATTDGPLDFKGIAETAIVGIAPAIASAFADALDPRN